MDWYVFLAAFLIALLILLFARVPVAYAMLGIGVLGALVTFGSFNAALNQVVLSISSSVTSFTFTAIPLFILMGELLFRTKVAQEALGEIALVLNRMPGRLAMVAVGGGAMFGLLSGSTLANTALFGRTLLPEMEEKGYDQRLAVGSIMASGGLAMILPPSALAILWGGIAEVPIGPLLIAGIIPGLMMSVGYMIVVTLKRKGVPEEETPPKRGFAEIVRSGVRHALGPGIIIAIVLGLIFFGIATPTESAAVGAMATLVLGLAMRRMTLRIIWDSAVGTLRTSTVIFIIVLGSNLYSQLMSTTGATRGLVKAVTANITSGPVLLLVLMLILLVLGALIDQVSIMMVTAPLFMPLVAQFGWDPVWFSMLLLINLQIAQTTPPFGMSLFVMKGVAPHLTLPTLYKSVLPWVTSDSTVILICAIFPSLVLVLPRLMAG
ncbi:TRAP transporter, DctM subunit [Raineyella antarctica]|uniref:TRAP transporter, DctM subunit n=1 Tax=Raineyella antarctica TaxID=1577474 RepID=A0A1G6GL63_9ACTN|nr:TRAP transporter large permease subunit [Raineyella antarctica]SDB81906.1 TRAP transporter, DctM subunit [Raineyella antarctica]